MRSRVCTRRCLFRLLAILLGLLPFVLIEIGLRIAGIGYTAATADPFVEFSAAPLFQLNEQKDRYVIPASRQPFFKSDSFAARKPSDEFRIFCLGGSTVQGNPYSIETSFTTWLELSLRAADPSRQWEVVNCGGISYASYRLAPVLRECLRYQPDLFILYVGDNEFLESRSYAPIQRAPPVLAWFMRQASHSRLFHVVRQLWIERRSSGNGSAAGKPSLSDEVEALLDYQGGLALYHRDDEWRKQVTEHFAFTLSSMLQDARSANVPVLLVDPVSNIKDCPPFKVEVDAKLSSSDRERLIELQSEAEQAVDLADRIQSFEKAREIDPGHAGVQYLLGHAYLEADREADARQALFKAKDDDVCPLRLTEPLRDVIYSVGQVANAPIVPVLKEFERRSPHGIPGDEMLLDHVHPTISGHQVIADLLLVAMEEQGWLKPGEGWKVRQRQTYQSHLATLDAPYYARGKEHLAGLRRWTQGRVNKLRSPAK
jgi:hypothetical protein